MSKEPPKLTFAKPSGQSRLSEESKEAISKEDSQKFSVDLPVSLYKKAKMRAIELDTTLKDLIVKALTNELDK